MSLRQQTMVLVLGVLRHCPADIHLKAAKHFYSTLDSTFAPGSTYTNSVLPRLHAATETITGRENCEWVFRTHSVCTCFLCYVINLLPECKFSCVFLTGIAYSAYYLNSCLLWQRHTNLCFQNSSWLIVLWFPWRNTSTLAEQSGDYTFSSICTVHCVY